jgi:hypothetical protein
MNVAANPLRLEASAAIYAMTEDGAVVIAALGDGVPPTVDVLPNGDQKLKWQAAVVSWPLARPSTGAHTAFLAVFPLPARERDNLRSVSILLPGRAVSLPLRKPLGGLDTIFKTVAEESGPAFPIVVDGFVEALLGEGAGPARVRAVAAMVRLVARRTGFIEVCGPGQDDEIFIQGWATDLPPGRIRVLVASEPPMLTELASVSYERDDLSGRGKGFAGLLQRGSLSDPASLIQFLYRGDDAWRAVDIYEQRKMITAGDVPVHLRSLLPRATGPEDVLARLRRTAHRFDGQETVSQLQEPVRLGIDVAVHVPGAGILIAGWLLDPKDRVEAVRLRAGSQIVVISNDWTRLTRTDVAGAYANDPLFRNLTANTKLSGFLAFGHITSAQAESAHLELDLGDNRPPSFFPLAVTDAPPREALARLLQSVDMRSGAAETIVERQFGPMLRSLEPAPAVASDVTDIGAFDIAAPMALVIGGDEHVSETLSLLALLAIDPFARTLPIVLAAPADALASFAGEIRRLATFYRLSIRLVSSASGSDVYDSLEAGTNATNAETLALLSSHVLPGTADWLSRLLQTYRLRGEQHLVSPTILFEDGSIRWAGSWLDEHDGRRELTHPHLGYPRAALAGAGLEQISAGTLDCCVLPRAAFVAADGFARGYLSLTAKNADMALRIRLAGTPALWQPEIEMLSAEDGSPAGAVELTHRIDRWSFDHRWSLALATVRE